MNGLMALLGAGEYLPVMEPVDRFLLAGLGLVDRPPRVVCLPTAAGREGTESIQRWSRMGVEHFQRLGAEVQALPIIDRASAEDPQFEPALEAADLVYFSGGDPNYLYQTLIDSRAWKAAQKAWDRGAIYAGCSAGAMILAQTVPNLRKIGTGAHTGFGIFPSKYIFPHFDQMAAFLRPILIPLRASLKGREFVLGIEENTALIGRLGGEWLVMGAGRVHVIYKNSGQAYAAGETFTLMG